MAAERIYDAVLIGAGPGSLTAALRLADLGLEPLILERSDRVGGATAYSGGVVWAPCNHRMRAKGIADSEADALAYLDSVSKDRGNRELAAAYVAGIAPLLEWLEEKTPLRWMSYRGLPDYFAENPGGRLEGRCLLPQPRLADEALSAAAERRPGLARVRESVHFPHEREVWAAGRALVGCLWSSVLERGIDYRLDSRATRLIVEEGEVAGVEVETVAGGERFGARRGVLLNTGGFEWNESLTRACLPAAGLAPQTPPVGEGDGHLMAAELGAAFALMDQTLAISAIRPPGDSNDGLPLYRLFFQPLALPHSLLVNRRGRRFADETFFPDIARAWTAHEVIGAGNPNLPAYFVFDERYRREHGFPAGLEPGECLTEHPDLAALARDRGIDEAGLLAQVERLNADAARGEDTEFGRGSSAYRRAFAPARDDGSNPTVGAVAEPPFYCVEIFASTSGHRGGVVVDADGGVLDVRGRRLRGLYACGSTVAGLISGGTYLSGLSLGQSLFFGHAAAQAMSHNHANEQTPTPGSASRKRGS